LQVSSLCYRVISQVVASVLEEQNTRCHSQEAQNVILTKMKIYSPAQYPNQAQAASLLRSLDHTQTHIHTHRVRLLCTS